MLGMKVMHIVANGASQSASELTTFINGGYNRDGIDAYLITRATDGTDPGEPAVSLGATYNDFSKPIFQLDEESGPVYPAENPHFRLWEEAGTSPAPERPRCAYSPPLLRETCADGG
jgi:hypothetical protein